MNNCIYIISLIVASWMAYDPPCGSIVIDIEDCDTLTLIVPEMCTVEQYLDNLRPHFGVMQGEPANNVIIGYDIDTICP